MEEKTRILVFDADRREFFAGVEMWSKDQREALDFQQVDRASRFVRLHPDSSLQIVQESIDNGEGEGLAPSSSQN